VSGWDDAVWTQRSAKIRSSAVLASVERAGVTPQDRRPFATRARAVRETSPARYRAAELGRAAPEPGGLRGAPGAGGRHGDLADAEGLRRPGRAARVQPAAAVARGRRRRGALRRPAAPHRADPEVALPQQRVPRGGAGGGDPARLARPLRRERDRVLLAARAEPLQQRALRRVRGERRGPAARVPRRRPTARHALPECRSGRGVSRFAALG